jgi:polyphosphate kinase
MSGQKSSPGYFNRELSWLEFNARVLEEGLSKDNPLLERLMFLCIVSSNFDEFFMVRVASIKAMLRNGQRDQDCSGLSREEVLSRISSRVRELIVRQYAVLKEDILPSLAAEGLKVIRPEDYDAPTSRWLEAYFSSQVAPALTPLAVPATDAGRFPSTGNLRIHAAFLLAKDNRGSPETFWPDSGDEPLAIVQLPPNLGRFVRLPPAEDGTLRLALLDDIVLSFGHRLFPGYHTKERALFKVTRDADIGVDEDRDDDFVAAMEEILVNRQNSWPVRITLSTDSATISDMVAVALGLGPDDIYHLPGPIDLKSFMELTNYKGFDRLRFPRREPVETLSLSEDNTIWDELRKQDFVVHLPYESFRPVEQLIQAAAVDPAVLAIKIALYRTSGDSPVIKALTKAAQDGKQVTAIVELKARFDEERNMAWASRLEQAGAIVVFGVARLKVHAKMCLVVRKEEDGIVRRYAHLSTGNYNDRTARLYGDLSYFTANPGICEDVGACFNMLTGVSAVMRLSVLSMAPFDLKRRILSMIKREEERSTPEVPGFIAAKMNGLTDVDIINALYQASAAGVRILLNVRGVCLLVPGVKRRSENIKVVSIVGRYLEHARIYYFRNGGSEELFLASSDWMPRNLERRIELMFPVCGEQARERVYDLLMSYFVDNRQARVLSANGVWKRLLPAEGEEPFSAQDYFYDEAKSKRVGRPLADHGQILPVRRRVP